MTGEVAQQDRTPRKRKRRRRKDARPGELIEAGLQEFAEKGFAATRLEDVAARAGVVKGTICLYFDNKEALFKAAVQSNILPTIDKLHALIDSYPGNTEDLLRLVLATMYDKLVKADVRVMLRILIAEGPRFPEILQFYHDNAIKVAEDSLRTILERGVERGEFRDDFPVDQPLLVAAPAIVAGLWSMTFESIEHLDIDAYASAHADVILSSLKRHP